MIFVFSIWGEYFFILLQNLGNKQYLNILQKNSKQPLGAHILMFYDNNKIKIYNSKGAQKIIHSKIF